MKTEFELIIDKLNLDERNISYTAEDEYLHINSILDFFINFLSFNKL